MMKSPARILYVDNDHESCKLIRNSFLRDEKDFDISCVTGTAEALARMRHASFDVFILEYSLFEMTGAEMCRKIRQTDRDTPIVIYSALFREIDRKNAMDAGANAFIVKSDGFSNLTTTLRRLLTPHPVISRHYHSTRRSSSIF